MKTRRNIIHQHTNNTIHCFIRFWPLMTIHSSISVPFGFASSALFSFFSIERQSVLADQAKMWDVRRKRVPAVSVDTPPTLFVAELPASLWTAPSQTPTLCQLRVACGNERPPESSTFGGADWAVSIEDSTVDGCGQMAPEDKHCWANVLCDRMALRLSCEWVVCYDFPVMVFVAFNSIQYKTCSWWGHLNVLIQLNLTVRFCHLSCFVKDMQNP